MLRQRLVLGALAVLAACAPRATGRTESAPAAPAPGPDFAAITESDLRRDLTAMASDAFRGREAGTLDELRASAWLGDRAREAGLIPGGDDGTYFQFWPMRRARVAATSRVSVGGREMALWRDVVITAPVNASLDVPLVYVGEGRPADLDGVDLRGKAAVASIHAPNNPPPDWISLRPFRWVLSAIAQQSAALAERGAAAVVLVSDSLADLPMGWGFGSAAMSRGRYGLDTGRADMAAFHRPPVLWTRRSQLEALRAPGARLTASIQAEVFTYPSVNVIGVVPGSDPARRGQYVVFSGHQDHDGVRATIDGDSIWNGADDNASTSVALLAIARAVHAQPMPRSALFIWHGAEERGLLGSRWYVSHPTVPLASIVAVLNGDMLGRNAPDSAALLGAQPPHMDAPALAQAALDANARWTHFAIDSTWDRPTHAERWWFRSDHLPYAEAKVPALFFTTLLHPDYHTPRDEASRIDYPKLARMARWMYGTGWVVGNR